MKFVGKIGFWVDEMETAPGVWRGCIIERRYVGEVLSSKRIFQSAGEKQNDEFKVNNRISILSDLYMRNNWASIRYVIWNGAKLKVTSVTMGYPRIILEMGGIYNGEDQTDAPDVSGGTSGE